MSILKKLANVLIDLDIHMERVRPAAIDETLSSAMADIQGALNMTDHTLTGVPDDYNRSYQIEDSVVSAIGFLQKADAQRAEWLRDLARLDELETQFDQMEAHIARAYGAFEGEVKASDLGPCTDGKLAEEPLECPYDVMYQVFGALSKDEVITLLAWTSSPSDAAAMAQDETYVVLGTKLVDTRYSVAEAVRLEFGRFLNWTKTELFDYAMG